MAPLPPALIALVQPKFDAAASAAIMASFTEPHVLPAGAILGSSERAVIETAGEQFNFALWSGIPRVWLDQCFGPKLAEQLLQREMIKIDEPPAEEQPQPRAPSSSTRLYIPDPPITPKQTPLPAPFVSLEFDLAITEAAGFHRAMNLWNALDIRSNRQEVQKHLREQATHMATLLAPYDLANEKSLLGKFNGFGTLKCQDRGP